MKKIIPALLLFLTSVMLFLYLVPVVKYILPAHGEEPGPGEVIGGADGPTVIFFTSQTIWIPITLLVVVILLTIHVVHTRLRDRKKHKSEDR